MYLAKKKKDCAVGEKDKRAIKSAAKFTPAKETVLIVDDSDINREILVSILKNEYDLIEAADGEECINKLNEYGTRISAVLLDLIMPNMNGFDVLDYMNKNDLIGEIPVITITGDESQNTVRVAYEKGVSDYITRPFDAKVVYRRVSNTIKVYSRQKRLIFELKSQMREKEKNRDMIVEILCRIIENAAVTSAITPRTSPNLRGCCSKNSFQRKTIAILRRKIFSLYPPPPRFTTSAKCRSTARL